MQTEGAGRGGSRGASMTGQLRPKAGTRLAVTLFTAVFLAIASSACAHGDPVDQIEELTRQIASEPDAALYMHRADLHRTRRQWAEAIADLQAASRLDPKLTAVDLLAAKVLFEADNPHASLAAVDRFLDHHGDHAAARLIRARSLAKIGRHEEAAGEFTRGIDLARAAGVAPQPADYLDRARELASTGETRIEEAIRGLDEGAAVLGGAITLQLRAIELETERASWTSALARLAAVEAAAQRKEQWIARRADVLVRAGRSAEAIEAFEEALAAIDALPARLRGTEATRNLAATMLSRLAALRGTAGENQTCDAGGQETWGQ